MVLISLQDAKILLEMLHPSPEALLGFRRKESGEGPDSRKGTIYTEIEFTPNMKFDPDDENHRQLMSILAWLRGRDGVKPRSISAIRSHTPKYRHIDIENLYKWVIEDGE